MSQSIMNILPWLAGGTILLLVLTVLRRPLKKLFRLGVRSAVGLAVLSVLGQTGQYIGVTLGVNWMNALVLGALGAPGFGLLLMLNWMLK